MKRLFAAVLAVILACSLTACNGVGDQTSVQFKEAENGYALYRYKGASTQLEFDVPETHEGKPVTELMAFSLANSEYLETIRIGKNIEKIDAWALTNCPKLKEIQVDAGNAHFQAVDGVLYNKDKTVLLAYPNGKTPLTTDKDGKVTGGGVFSLPASVKEIGNNAFYLCENLYSITLNHGLEKVGDKAFLKCINLSALDLPDTLREIGTDAFSYCNALTALEIPASVRKIGDYAFFSTASSLEKVVVRQASAEALELGKDWLPNKKNSVREKVRVEYMPSA